MTLEELRKRLTDVDRELIGLVAARQKIIAEIGAHKIQNAVPTRDYEREREVLKGAREQALELGWTPDIAERNHAAPDPRVADRAGAHARRGRQRAAPASTCSIIGGAGKMGAWFAQFLGSQGFAVEVADPSAATRRFRVVPTGSDSALDHDLIVVATPMKVAARVLVELAERRPHGLVVDIGSLKSPLRAGLQQLVVGGLQGDVDSPDVRARIRVSCRVATSCSATWACPRPRARRARCSPRRWPSSWR